MARKHQAAVLGAGPGGLAAVCGLLDAGLQANEVVWLDRDFNGGRLNGMYREISSNTKIGIYLSAFDSSRTCRDIIDAHDGVGKKGESSCSNKGRSPVDRMRERDHEKTCQLSLAGDVVMMLVEGLRTMGVVMVKDEVKEIEHDHDSWILHLAAGSVVTTAQLVLATGSHPIIPQPPIHRRFNPTVKLLDLDQCMMRSRLPDLLRPAGDGSDDTQEAVTVGVIGNSHSGILVCRNLYEYALGLPNHQDESDSSDTQSSRPQEDRRKLKILNFHRRPIKYAIYRDDGIVNDNTGLKGATADWAKKIMETNRDPETLEQVTLTRGASEDEVYRERLAECTHLVYAIGYEPNPLPRIGWDGQDITDRLGFDMHSGGFHLSPQHRVGRGQSAGVQSDERTEEDMDDEDRIKVPGLYGCGMPFPELVEDPEGNVEAAVGLAKFFKFTERVGKEWVKA